MAHEGKRSMLKSSIMKIAQFSKRITENADVFEIESLFERLDDLWIKYEDVHMKIVESTGPANMEYEQIEYSDTENLIIETRAIFKRALKSRKPSESQNEDNSQHQRRRFQNQPYEDTEFAGLRVPRVSVTEFSGDYLEWPSFRDLFTSLVGNNPKVPNVQKLSYLKKVVIGDAAKLIHNIKITSDNFQAAWEILKNRFENERIIVTELLNNIFKIPNATGKADDIKLILDTTLESLRELKNLKRPVEHYGDWLVFVIVKKLDQLSLEKWNEMIGDERDVIEWEKLEEFLNVRFRVLEGNNTVESKPVQQSKSLLPTKSSKSAGDVSESIPKAVKCYYCKGGHRAKSCFTFKKKNPSERRMIVESANLCFNCLSPGHKLAECSSTRSCFKCGLQHHSLLHLDSVAKSEAVKKRGNSTAKAIESTSSSSSSSLTNHLVEHISTSNKDVLLATAIIVVKFGSGKQVSLRALLDQGSQMSLISTFAAKRLQLVSEPYMGVPLTGAGGELVDTRKGVVNFNFHSKLNGSQFQTNALILDTVSHYQLPNGEIFPEACKLLQKSELADPNFDNSDKIDVLLAADVYAQVVLEGVRKFNGILVQNTSLGWILSGRFNQERHLMPSLSIHHVSVPLDKLLQSFWEIEELPPGPNILLSVDELACETHFQDTHSRNSKGRYVVRLPFKVFGERKELGYSRGIAISSQIRMENRFMKNPILKEKYHKFMEESIEMGHMELVPKKDLDKPTSECFYMPHHAVVRESSTTSLRVVFNASQKSSTGISLNDLLHTGPKLQSHLFDILIRYRKHFVCFKSDTEKMYRRILVHRKDRDFQRIVWRTDPKQHLETYRMRVVTDGTSSAPYLAIRTVRQLAQDEKENYPLAYQPLMEDTFMDDLVSGSKDILSGIEQIKDINNIFKTAGMRMRKWTSNMGEVLQDIPPEDRQNTPVEFDHDEFIKVLGIQWFPSTDCFGFKVRLPPAEDTTTKRKLLSHASKLFDPLGFLSPCTVIPKILFQNLWELKLDWDEPLPEDIKKRWVKFHNELPLLEAIKIPRFIGALDSNGGTFELHGFSDASKVAYSAVVYSRIEYPDGSIKVNLLAAKTKVTPVKKITIPCAELCGAFLVSRLLKKVQVALNIDISMNGWTDSEIVLDWLRKSPGSWQQFVGNRTSKILDIVPYQNWNYVETSENPADCASRGILPSQLVKHSLWWNGPAWLSENKLNWPSRVTPRQLKETEFMKLRSVMNLVTVDTSNQFLERFSSLQKLIRTTAWCLRFIINVKRRISERSEVCHSSKQPVQGLEKLPFLTNLHHGGPRKCESRHQENSDQKSVPFLTVLELKNALKLWIRIVQESSFSKELEKIKYNKSIRRGKLRKLNPKIDMDEGVLRVGGRLTNAHIPYDQKFPMVLPNDSHLTSLIIGDAHAKTLHGNVQLMLNYLRQRYWILGARRVVRQFIKKRCKICIKWSSAKQKQQMAALPRPRVVPSRPFSHTGVDFAGPIYIKDKGRGKNQSLSKGYIAIFICLSTKAVHLEAAEDLSTKEFIESFKRFVGRHSIPKNMYSDNGSNFVGCTTELTKLQENAIRQQMVEIAALLANDGVEWKFNPPTASHFGGIWEAAVKSMKYHLRRIVGSAHLTFKDLTTLLCQIECALNSRPICSLTDDPDDLTFLTPGHFTMGTSPTTLPEESLLNINENRLTKWQRTQQMFQNFWKHWSIEYLSNLQNRSKWFDEEDNLKVGELVILKEEDVPPTKWLMGRVIEVHPGNDGLVRAVTVRLKCKHHTLTRPIHKLCRLPFLKSDELDVGL